MIDVVVIGAGPAGLSAAISCREHDLNVVVIDEFMKPGGRLLGQLHQEPDGKWWNGIEETAKLMSRVKDLDVDLRLGYSVHHLQKKEAGFVVHSGPELFEAANVLIATGAAESPAPVPGWTLPGVMSIGAAQVMTNVHRVRVGKRGIVVGVNVLSVAIARELQLAGVQLHGMLLPALNAVTGAAGHPRKVIASMTRIAHLAPSAWIRYGSKLARWRFVRDLALHFYPKKGIGMWNMPIHLRQAVVKIDGAEAVESVTICDVTPEGVLVPGSERKVDVDFVCIAGGLYPLVELAAVMGCPFQYIEELGGHVPIHSEQMQTPINGLFVAGNITGIESAKVAAQQGTLAGLSIVKRMKSNQPSIDRQVLEATARVKTVRQAATIQFHPGIEEGRKKMEAAFREN